MLAMTKAYNLHLHQLNVDSAFLYADLDEDVYLTPPSGMDGCTRGILPEAAEEPLWTEAGTQKLEQEHIKSLGFKQCVADNCLFVKRVGGKMYLISLYVDQTWTKWSESSDSSLSITR